MPSTFVDAEIASQPQTWAQAAALALTPAVARALPRPGERVSVVGCGTSWFVAMSVAVLREQAGHGVTDAFAGSEFPVGRGYDRVVAISRSGTTTEIVELLARLDGTATTLITAVGGSPAAASADLTVELPFADERSVVQTRFATAALTLLRAHLGTEVSPLVDDARRALEVPVDELLIVDQCTFVGIGWCVGLANEAALKTREAAQFWAEAYPAMDYRHGPIAIAQPGRLVWSIGEAPVGLRLEVVLDERGSGRGDVLPQAALVVAQRFAVALSKQRGLDPDRPRSLTRSVILA